MLASVILLFCSDCNVSPVAASSSPRTGRSRLALALNYAARQFQSPLEVSPLKPFFAILTRASTDLPRANSDLLYRHDEYRHRGESIVSHRRIAQGQLRLPSPIPVRSWSSASPQRRSTATRALSREVTITSSVILTALPLFVGVPVAYPTHGAGPQRRAGSGGHLQLRAPSSGGISGTAARRLADDHTVEASEHELCF